MKQAVTEVRLDWSIKHQWNTDKIITVTHFTLLHELNASALAKHYGANYYTQLTRQALLDAGAWQKQANDTGRRGEDFAPGAQVWVFTTEQKKGLSPKRWVLYCAWKTVWHCVYGATG